MLRLRPARKVLFAIVILGIVTAILLMFAQDQETLRLQSQYSAEDPRFPAYLAALVGSQPTGGNRYTVLTNGDQFFPAMLDAIKSAKTRISFETYIYDAGTLGGWFTSALADAARRGVQVNLVVDAMGAKTMDPDHVKRLREAGCHVGQYHLPRWYTLEEVNYRTHRKILVVDGRVAFTGGAGISDQWIGNAEGPGHWRDTQIEIEGPAVRLVEAAFYEDFIETSDVARPALDLPWQVDAPSPNDSAIVVRSSPTGGSNDLKRLYLLAIAAARRTLDICSPYFVLDESTEWAIDQAVGRGVRVRILVEGDETDAMPVKYASRAAYDGLLQRGVAIYEYQPTMMHTKVLVVDGIWSMVGSANFDNRSLELNDEMNVGIADRALAARLLQDFEADLRRSRQLDLATWRQRSLLEKSREHFWSYFGEIF